MLLVPALAVLAAAALARARRGPRLALRGALVVALAWNVVWIVRLADSFRALRVTPIW
jgi:hypothetical protein